MNFDIRKGDEIYLVLKSWEDVDKYKDVKDMLTYKATEMDVFIYNVNAINKYHDGNLDVVLSNGITVELVDNELRETVARYDVDFDLYNSVIEYLWKEIKII